MRKTVPDLDSGFVSGKWFRGSFTWLFEHFQQFQGINMPKEILTLKDFHSDISVFIQLQDNTDAEVIHHILFRQSSAA